MHSSRRLALLIAAIAVSFAFSLWHRTQADYEALDGRFTGNDAYLYYRQAERIVEEGRLPKRDMERWLPLGRDLTLLHNLYSYVIAYSYKTARVFVPDLTLHKFSCYAPPVLFAMTAALFTASLLSLYGWEAAGLGGLFFVLAPSVASRTALGFADRDAFCLFLAVLLGCLYLQQIRADSKRARLIFASAAGFTACFGCLAWEGFGPFALCVLAPALIAAWRRQNRMAEALLYCGCWALPLLALSSAHRFWDVPSEPAHPVGMIAVFPALLAAAVLLARQAFRADGAQTRPSAAQRHPAVKFAALLPVLLLTAFLVRRFLLSGEASLAFAVPFSNSRLMQTVSELQDMGADEWKRHFSALPVIAAAGVIGAFIRLWKRRKGKFDPLLFAALWIGVWGCLTIGSVRYSIMLAPALAAVSAVALVWAGNTIQPALSRALDANNRRSFAAREGLRYVYMTLIPMTILYWGPAGRIVPQAAESAALRPPVPSAPTLEAYRWTSAQLTDGGGKQPVIAARWGSGSQINVLADAKTIEDQDLWKHYWIHLSARHLYCAESETEALRFLKTREADYWILSLQDLMDGRAQGIEWLASGTISDRSAAFARGIWIRNGSEAFELVFENTAVKVFRVRYPPDITVPQNLYAAWTASEFPDPVLRLAWMQGN